MMTQEDVFRPERKSGLSRALMESHGDARFGGVANIVVRCGESIVLFRVTEHTVQPSTYQASASQPACEERGTDLGH